MPIRPVLRLCLLVLVSGMVGCASPPPPGPPLPPAIVGADGVRLDPERFSRLEGWADDRHAEALAAFLVSCDRWRAVPAGKTVRGLGATVRVGTWHRVCTAAAAVPPGDDGRARAFFEDQFQAFRVSRAGAADGLFTGYYEPELRGSAWPDRTYSVPLYRRPPDLVTGPETGRRVGRRIVPYYDRAAIVGGALKGRRLELVWVDDPVDAFFLQIQGSGRVVLPNGRVVRLGYAAQNGHDYFPIGRALVDRGDMTFETVSMPAIRAWLERNPEKADAVMNLNRSYVFFRVIDGAGPIGAEGVPLTPGRSLAVDDDHWPYGVPVWLDADDPLDEDARVRRLMVAQDTGGAIRGVVRGDVFWGHGPDAERRAGVMRSRGGLWILLPRPGRHADHRADGRRVG